MMTLQVFELENGRFTVRALAGLSTDFEAGEFDTRLEAEEWLFQKSEQLESGGDPDIIRPGDGQGVG